MRQAAFLVALLGCEDPDGNGAIEITGYLDAAQVSWTRYDGEVQALGRAGAASPLSTVRLENTALEQTAEGLVSELGTFLLSVPGEESDRLILEVDGAPAEEDIEHDVPTHGAFPAYVHATGQADPHDPHVAVVEVTLEPAREDGEIWVANPHAEAAVVVLDTFDGGFVHGARLAGREGDALRAHWVPDTGVESLAIQIEVGAPVSGR